MLFEHPFFPVQLLSFSVIGSVIQADCIKAISAKWNMCPVSAAHSLFIRLLTSETNLKKKNRKKNKAVYGPMGWRSTRWCHPGGCAARWFILNVINLSLPGRLHSPPSEREKGRNGGGGWRYMIGKGTVYQGLGCFTFVWVNLGKPCSPKFKADSMWFFTVLRVIMNGKIKSLWYCHNWASSLWMISRCPFFCTNAFATAIKILSIIFSFHE